MFFSNNNNKDGSCFNYTGQDAITIQIEQLELELFAGGLDSQQQRSVLQNIHVGEAGKVCILNAPFDNLH